MAAEKCIGQSRQCKKCAEVKDLSLFERHPTCKLGRLHACKVCSIKAKSEYQRRPEVRRKRSEAASRKWRSDPAHRAKMAEAGKRYFGRADVQELNAARNRKRRADNPERAREMKRRLYAAHKDEPRNRCVRRIAVGVRNSLRCGRKSAPTFAALGYTVEELMRHLERQFTGSMSWDNQSEWHIDHIVPLSSFEFVSTDCPGFKRAWALTNLRPLWAVENMKKHAKRVYLI